MDRVMLRSLVLVASLTTSTLALAQEGPGLRTLMQARNFGMGGAYRAHGLGAEAVLGNPAALALFPAYRIELTGGWDAGEKDAFGTVTLADSTTSRIAAGLSYSLVSLGRADARRNSHFSTLALSLPLAPGLLAGGSVHYLANNGSDAKDITGDAGLLARFGRGVLIGVSGHNLVAADSPLLGRYFTAHAGYLTGLFTAAADVSADFEGERTAYFWSGGAEYLLGQSLPVRAGYAYDTASRTSFLGAGLGLLAPDGGLDFGYRHELGGRKSRWLALTFKMQVR
jgi:opacity protein-like surface antigen